MKIKEGTFVIVKSVKPVPEIGLVVKKLERVNIEREEDKQWVVITISGRRNAYLPKDLIFLKQVSEIDEGLPITTIFQKYLPELVAIIIVQIEDLSGNVQEIYRRITGILSRIEKIETGQK